MKRPKVNLKVAEEIEKRDEGKSKGTWSRAVVSTGLPVGMTFKMQWEPQEGVRMERGLVVGMCLECCECVGPGSLTH